MKFLSGISNWASVTSLQPHVTQINGQIYTLVVDIICAKTFVARYHDDGLACTWQEFHFTTVVSNTVTSIS